MLRHRLDDGLRTSEAPQRPSFLAGVHLQSENANHDLRARRFKARLGTVRSRARRARFTALESGNAAATSASRTTMLLPSRTRAAYLPLTPPRKSYSFRISFTRPLSVRFFINSPLPPRRRPGADQADLFTSFGVSGHQQLASIGESEEQKPFLIH